VTSDAQFLDTFTPDSRIEVGYDLSYFSALAFLQQSNKLWVVRAAKQAKFSGLSLRTAASSLTNFNISAGLSDPTAYVFDAAPDTPAVAEVTTVTVLADVAGSLNNVYFTLLQPSPGTGFYVWYNVNGAGTDPAPGGGLVGVEVAVSTNATAAQVATATAAALDALPAFLATAASATVTVTNAVAGNVGAPTAATSGFTLNVTVQGADAVAVVDECILIYASSPGLWGSSVGVKIFTYDLAPEVVKEPGAFLIEVYKTSNLQVPVESFICSRDIAARDGFGRNIFVDNVLQGSSFIRAISNPAVASTVYPKAQSTILLMAGGTDGLAVTDSEMIAAANTMASPDDVPVTLLMDGGFASPAYQSTLNAIASTRMDCVALLSVPIAKEIASSYLTDIVDYRRTELNLNTSYSALFSPHALVYDRFNDRRVYVAPDGYAGAAISFSASNFEIWFPPAGFRRGLVQVLDLRRRFTRGELDALYDAGINPLRFAPGKGIAIWGQKTLLSRPSALDRLNVRLLLIVIEPAIAAALEDFLFELNDQATRNFAVSVITSYLDGIKARRGIDDFLVVSDDSNNTPSDVDNNKMNVDVYVKPKKSVEFIPLRTIITSSGLSFAQAATLV
jgi:hypothetical protein